MRLPFEELENEEPKPAVPIRRNVYAAAEIAQPKKEAKEPADRLLYYLSIGSGSSGNCCYLGTKKGGVLIDAGVKTDIVEAALRSNGIDLKKVTAVVLTHDHSDHVKYVYTLVRNNKHMRVFCTNRVLSGIMRRHSISKRLKDFHMPIFKEIPFTIGELEVTAFEVPHDGSDNMGFSIAFDNRRFVLATDLGAVTERARHEPSQLSCDRGKL